MLTSTEKIAVLIAEDHAIVRAGVKMLVDLEDDMTVIGEAQDGDEAIALAQSLRPDVVLMDVTMPNTDGIVATRRIKSLIPAMKVLVLTRHDEDGYLQHLIAAGADGYVLKQNSSSQVIEALRAVHAGRSYVDHSLTRNLLQSYQTDRTPNATGVKSVSTVEESVLRLVAFGNSYKEIADQLRISARTVENARKSGMAKLGFESRVDIVKYAIGQGWMHDN